MDIETDVECNSRHGVVVCSHSHDESERIPRRVRGRSCGSAHAGNLRYNDGNHTAFFNPGAEHAVGAISHEV